MRRVLVTGANGQLGLALKHAAEDFPLNLVFMDKNALDITDTEAVKELFANQAYDFCINAAAYTDVDGAETNKGLAYAINAKGVEALAKACKLHQSWLIHISTDYVFDGALDRPYTPSDMTNPLNVYGQSKLAGEQLIDAVGCIYSIVRTSWLYSHYGNNFYTKLLAQVNTGKALYVTAEQKGCPTRADDLASHLLKGITSQQLPTGISHYCGNEVMTWLDLARRLFNHKEVFKKPKISLGAIRPKKVELKSTIKH